MSTDLNVLPPSRRVALDILDAVLPVAGKVRPQDVQDALDRRLATLADPRDRRLATELVYGWLRLKGRLDFVADSLLAKPAKTPPVLKRILSLALYELHYLDQVPDHATLTWAVAAARKRVGAFASGLANGVLRAAQRLGTSAREPDYFRRDHCDEATFLSRYASTPLWMVHKLLAAYDPQKVRRLLESQLQPPPLGLRVNAARASAPALFERLAADPGMVWSAYPALACAGRPACLAEGELEALERQGELSRQSAAVHRALSLLECARWPHPVFDACAGRGGKTALLLESGISVLAASDRSARRLFGLRQELARLDLPSPLLYQGDARHPALCARPATILLDAPCTGLGVLARRPDAKWKRTPADVAALSRLQSQMLEAAVEQLAPGGVLVYLTCTVLPEENAEQADRLESRHGLRALAGTDEDAFFDLGEFFWGRAWRKPG